MIGISPDTPEKQEKFDEKYGLGFPLLADTEHTVAEKYGVWGEKMNYGRKYMGIIRSAFVIDEQGKIAGAFYKVSPKDTVPKVTATLNGVRARWGGGASRAARQERASGGGVGRVTRVRERAVAAGQGSDE